VHKAYLIGGSKMSLVQVEGKQKKKARKRIVGIIALALVIFLIIPFIFKPKPRASLQGPSLSEMEYTEIYFNSGDLQLAGMLFVPEGEGPFPTVVIIHGSGTSYRDSKWYLSVTQHLLNNGIAVLLPDKRGSEKSEGEWRGASFEDLAGDTLSAIEYLKSQDYLAYSSIGLLGMSQGGWIAPLAASKSEEVSFVVSMSGAFVTTDEQLLYEETNSIHQMGTYMFLAELIAQLTTKNIQQMDFWLPLAGYDPLPYWEMVNVPAFAAFGSGDVNVPVAESIHRLQSLGKDVKYEVYPEGGHGITEPNSGKVQIAYLNDLVAFILTSD
jgi:dipeptidyl aminopeptidase/acylaminoacyl peptidase